MKLSVFVFVLLISVAESQSNRVSGSEEDAGQVKFIAGTESFGLAQELMTVFNGVKQDNSIVLMVDVDLVGLMRIDDIYKNYIYIGTDFQNEKEIRDKKINKDKLYTESISIIVNSKNNVKLGREDVVKIFTKNESNSFLDWKSLGRDQGGKVVSHSPHLHDEFGMFMRKALNAKLRSDHEHRKFSEIIKSIEADPNSIGFVNKNYISEKNNKVKIVKFSSDEPNNFATRSGYICYPQKLKSDEALDFLRFLKSDQGMKSISSTGVDPHKAFFSDSE